MAQCKTKEVVYSRATLNGIMCLRPGLNVAFYMRRMELPNKMHVKSIKCDIFQFDASQSNIRLIQSNMRLKFDS